MSLAAAPAWVTQFKDVWELNRSPLFYDQIQSGASLKVRRDGGIQMLLTFEINVALWGMIVCAAMEAVRYLEVF